MVIINLVTGGTGGVCLLQLSLREEKCLQTHLPADLSTSWPEQGRGIGWRITSYALKDIKIPKPTVSLAAVGGARLQQRQSRPQARATSAISLPVLMSSFVASARGREAGVTQPRCCWRKHIGLQESIGK